MCSLVHTAGERAAAFSTHHLYSPSVCSQALRAFSDPGATKLDLKRANAIIKFTLLPSSQCAPSPKHNTYVSLAFEQLHWLLRVSSTECKGTESVGRFVFKPSQQLVQA